MARSCQLVPSRVLTASRAGITDPSAVTDCVRALRKPVQDILQYHHPWALRNLATSLLRADITPVQLSERVDLLEIVLKRAMDEPRRQDSGARRCHGL